VSLEAHYLYMSRIITTEDTNERYLNYVSCASFNQNTEAKHRIQKGPSADRHLSPYRKSLSNGRTRLVQVYSVRTE